jgi:nucleotide-binding universal stress UspA family protein
MLSKIILVVVKGSQPAKKALEYTANVASQNESHLYIMRVIEEFGERIDATMGATRQLCRRNKKA